MAVGKQIFSLVSRVRAPSTSRGGEVGCGPSTTTYTALQIQVALAVDTIACNSDYGMSGSLRKFNLLFLYSFLSNSHLLHTLLLPSLSPSASLSHSLSPLSPSSRVINHSRREGQLPLIDSSLLHTQSSCQPQKSKPRRDKDESKCSFSGPSHSLKRHRSIVYSDTSQVNAGVINVDSPGARTFQCRDKSAATDKIQTAENTRTPHSTLSKVYTQSTHNKSQHSPVPDCAYLPTPPSRLGRNSFNQWVSVYRDKDRPQGKSALINEPDKNDGEELDRASVSKSVATEDKQTSTKCQSGGVMATGQFRKRREYICFVKKTSKMESDEKYQAVNYKSRNQELLHLQSCTRNYHRTRAAANASSRPIRSRTTLKFEPQPNASDVTPPPSPPHMEFGISRRNYVYRPRDRLYS